MQVKKQQLEPDMKQWIGSKLGREYDKAIYGHPAYLNSIQSTSYEMLGWMNHKLESRLLGEMSIISDMQMTPPQWQKANRNWSSFLIKVKKEIEKDDLKLNIQKMKITASSPITSWQIDGEKVEEVTDFIFGVSKITTVTAAMKLKDAWSLKWKLWQT